MSHLNYRSAEDVEYDNNKRNFFTQLMRDCLVSYTQNGEKRHIYVICPEYILMVRREYAFWWTDVDYYVRHLKELIAGKGFDYEMVNFTQKELGDYASASKLRKLYKYKKGLK